MSILTHQDCPKCGHKGCKTEWPDGGYYCHSCGDKPKGYRVPEKESIVVGYRGIDTDVAELFGVGTVFNPEGEACERLYPYDTFTKTRTLDVKRFFSPKGSKPHLFGYKLWNAGSSKYITLVEGEDDTLAAYQMLGKKYPVVGLPGAQQHSLFREKEIYDYLNAFENIILALDGDAPGKASAARIAEMFPNKCYEVSLTKYKDACEYLENNAKSDFFFAWVNRKKYVPEWDVNTPEQFLRILDEGKDSKYVETGIKEFDEVACGLMQGHLTVFTAPEGIGKTEFMRMLEWQLLSSHPDLPFAYCHMEESKMRSILGLASYALQKNVTRRSLITDMAEVKDTIRGLTENETMHQFHLGVDEEPEILVERVKYYANVCDCKYVFFEPIQDLAHQRTNMSESSEQLLSRISVQLSRVASETGVGVVTIAHQNDQGEIRDCRLIGKQASVRVDLERDLMSVDENQRNTTRLSVVKNRPVGTTGFAGELMFDPFSFTLREKEY